MVFSSFVLLVTQTNTWYRLIIQKARNRERERERERDFLNAREQVRRKTVKRQTWLIAVEQRCRGEEGGRGGRAEREIAPG